VNCQTIQIVCKKRSFIPLVPVEEKIMKIHRDRVWAKILLSLPAFLAGVASANPASIISTEGWTVAVANIGIEWKTNGAPLGAGNSITGFQFNTSMKPSQMQASSDGQESGTGDRVTTTSVYSSGSPGDAHQSVATLKSVPRDWAGNGRSGVLLYSYDTGTAYTGLSNGNGTYQYVYNLFFPHFTILRSGDFNGDGKADLILYDYSGTNPYAYIGMGKGDGTFNFQSLFWSVGYFNVETGDLDGDGKTDIVLYNNNVGTMYTGISNGNGTFTYKYTLVSPNYDTVRVADFNGDGKADIFLYRPSDGLANLGIGDGAGGFTFHPLIVSPNYQFTDVGDLNGDGKADIILYDPGSGNAATGISNGSGGFTFTPLLFSPGFTSVRLADFTGDGKADVTLYNKDTAIGYFGTGTGTGTFNFQSLFWSPGYYTAEAQDVNGDGKADIVLYSGTYSDGKDFSYTGISNADGTFSYTYALWGNSKLLVDRRCSLATAYLTGC
jgi:hypothetical protein